LARASVGAVPCSTGNAPPLAPFRDDHTASRIGASSLSRRLDADVGHDHPVVRLRAVYLDGHDIPPPEQRRM
jgi:hypothetical protein